MVPVPADAEAAMLALTYPLIALNGIFQAMGAAMSGLLRQKLVDPWLAALVAFLPILLVLTLLVLAMPFPLPEAASFAKISLV